MIRINQIKLPIDHTKEQLLEKAAKLLKLPVSAVRDLRIVKQSLDARKKEEIHYIYTVDVSTDKEAAVIKKARNVNILAAPDQQYRFPASGTAPMKHRPVIIGSGPAGLFCGLMLAKQGYRPIILERGEAVDERFRRVNAYWEGKEGLHPNSNVQFGEGGAGTFSDGKLNTLVKDPSGRNRKVLEIFAEAGADSSILYWNKPHIGTDVLRGVVKNIRSQILDLGGEVRFLSQATGFRIEHGRLTGLQINHEAYIDTQAVVLATGHSARDTFQALEQAGVYMEQKAFAVGLRIQHPQSMVNKAQYGAKYADRLGAADYKLTRQCTTGRGVYSFCMCPGGYVVNASSEEGRIAVNGMSDHARDSRNANSAIIVTVTPEDFGSREPLSGVAFQRRLEELAYKMGEGRIPLQLYGDFKADKASKALGETAPVLKGGYTLSNLRPIFTEAVSASLIEGIESFDRIIPGFARFDALLAGVESRTSSPVRITRDEGFESSVKGLYPCGEGAGYAGGITSAAMDGIKVAEEIARRYAPLP